MGGQVLRGPCLPLVREPARGVWFRRFRHFVVQCCERPGRRPLRGACRGTDSCSVGFAAVDWAGCPGRDLVGYDSEGDRASERGRSAGPGRRRTAGTPPGSHGGWVPAADRPDPVALLEEQNATREPDLVPVRHGRMMVSPFTFYRGAAKIMAADLGVPRRRG